MRQDFGLQGFELIFQHLFHVEPNSKLPGQMRTIIELVLGLHGQLEHSEDRCTVHGHGIDGVHIVACFEVDVGCHVVELGPIDGATPN